MIESAKLTPKARTGLPSKWIAAASLGGVAILVSAAHLTVSSRAYEFVGALALLDRLFDLLLTAALSTLCFSVGRRIARALGLGFSWAAEELSFSILLGAGTIGTTVLAAGLVGLLKPLPILIVLGAFLLVSYRELNSLRDAVVLVLNEAKSSSKARRAVILFIALVGILSVRALLPPTDYDEAIYHLPVTKAFVEHGRVYPLYDNFSGNMPFLLHMVYAVCLIAKSDIAARLFSLMLAVATSVCIFGFCDRFLNRRTAMIALFAFFGAGMVVEVAVTTRIDVSLAGVLFAAFYAMAVFLETRMRGWFYASALLSGFALGIKYSALGWFMLILLMLVFETVFRWRQSVLRGAGQAVLYAAIGIAIASPWFIKNLLWFHNPVYPFVTGELADTGPGSIRYFGSTDQSRIDSHFAEAVREMPEDVEAKKLDLSQIASQREDRHPLQFWQYFLNSDKYNMSEPYQDPNYLFIVAPLFLFLGRKRWLIWLAVFSVGFYLFAVTTSWIARYLLPIYPPLTILSAYVLTEVGNRLSSRTRMAVIAPMLIAGLAVGSAVFVCATQIYNTNGVRFLTGQISREQFMYSTFYFPPLNYMNHMLPEDARVLMIGAQMGYDLKRDYIADAGWDATEWRRLLVKSDSLDGVNTALKNRGITHILLHADQFRYVALMGRKGSGPSGSQSINLFSIISRGNGLRDRNADTPDYEQDLKLWTIFDLYASRYLEPVFDDRQGDFVLYKVR